MADEAKRELINALYQKALAEGDTKTIGLLDWELRHMKEKEMPPVDATTGPTVNRKMLETLANMLVVDRR